MAPSEAVRSCSISATVPDLAGSTSRNRSRSRAALSGDRSMWISARRCSGEPRSLPVPGQPPAVAARAGRGQTRPSPGRCRRPAASRRELGQLGRQPEMELPRGRPELVLQRLALRRVQIRPSQVDTQHGAPGAGADALTTGSPIADRHRKRQQLAHQSPAQPEVPLAHQRTGQLERDPGCCLPAWAGWPGCGRSSRPGRPVCGSSSGASPETQRHHGRQHRFGVGHRLQHRPDAGARVECCPGREASASFSRAARQWQRKLVGTDG